MTEIQTEQARKGKVIKFKRGGSGQKIQRCKYAGIVLEAEREITSH